ncbi:cancer-related nucleoside-triphosphatase homolog [Lucilia sericata]|uniref:cancer-related nucleoside-triphosphatase homolog n=1 Tax=Lucilia sericata TaxID=13632 RepID=UPI0018A8427A|nr:cancer-related nucleoside-triphosphatase homolog [Lucilia sericata]
MTERFGLILITGPPGVGKTTLVRKICEDLGNKHKIVCNGFYTEEVRNPNSRERIGFDVVTFNEKRGPLARSDHANKIGPFVGKYQVYVKDFEELALPLLYTSTGRDLLVIDEVGKMELKSKKFEMAVQNCIMKTFLLATVPYELRQPIPLIDKLKNHPKAEIFVVTKGNRNCLQDEIVNKIFKLINK